MLATKPTIEFDLDKALIRMKNHAANTQSSFGRKLHTKAPSTFGRLAGSAKK